MRGHRSPRAARLIQPKVVIPTHYGTFNMIRQEQAAFCRRVAKDAHAQCVALKAGESYRVQ